MARAGSAATSTGSSVKTEGEGSFGEASRPPRCRRSISRAIGPYFNLQAGVRHDLGRRATRTYATIGVEGLAPYWFEVEGALFLSDKGDVLGRLEAYYDQRITQRLILQPRVELNFAAQDVPANRIGAGLVERRTRPAPALRDRARIRALCRRVVGSQGRRHRPLRPRRGEWCQHHRDHPRHPHLVLRAAA